MPFFARSRTAALALAVVAAAWFAAVAFAASQQHLPAGYHPGGTASSSTYSSWWRTENSHTSSSTDRTVTLIDNVSYGWHGTVRGTAADINARWHTTTGKKGYCRLHQGGYVACTAFDF